MTNKHDECDRDFGTAVYVHDMQRATIRQKCAEATTLTVYSLRLALMEAGCYTTDDAIRQHLDELGWKIDPLGNWYYGPAKGGDGDGEVCGIDEGRDIVAETGTAGVTTRMVLERQIESLRSQNDELNARIEKVRGERDAWKCQSEAHKLDKENAWAHHKAAQDARAAVDELLREAREQLAGSRRACGDLRDQLKTAISARDEARAELDWMRGEHDGVRRNGTEHDDIDFDHDGKRYESVSHLSEKEIIDRRLRYRTQDALALSRSVELAREERDQWKAKAEAMDKQIDKAFEERFYARADCNHWKTKAELAEKAMEEWKSMYLAESGKRSRDTALMARNATGR